LKSSIADKTPYDWAAYEAYLSDDAFSVFKQNLHYQNVLEHVSCELGLQYQNWILDRTGPAIDNIVAGLDKFKINDELGQPSVFDYGSWGKFSPTTLRYIKVLCDIQCIMLANGDSLTGKTIVEIGAGYGGQAVIVNQIYRPKNYTMIDLKSASLLQKKYIERLGVPNCSYVENTNYEQITGEIDLVISNYALSEYNRDVQRGYLEKIVSRAKHGYMTWNFISKACGVDSLEFAEVRGFLPAGYAITQEIPSSDPNNLIIMW
jgi:hypothetical protein